MNMVSIGTHILKRREGRPESQIECAKALGLMTVCVQAEMTLAETVITVWQNSSGAIRKLLERAIRKAALGGARSLEEAIEHEAKDLPDRIRWISQPIIDFIQSTDEPDEHQRHALIEKAHESSLASCRQAIREDTSTLRVPFSTIFAMGIVLPIIVATILPLWGMVSQDDLGWEYGSTGRSMATPLPKTPDEITLIGGITILAFPLVCIVATNSLVNNRELISNPMLNGLGSKMLFLFGILGALSLAIMLLFHAPLSFWVVIGALMITSFLAHRLFKTPKSQIGTTYRAESPSEMSSICGRLVMGEHPLRAILLSSRDSRSSQKLFKNALFTIGKKRDTGAFRLVEEASKKDPRIAARVFRQFSSHLIELGRIEDELRNELRPIAQSALVATLVLCPFVLGIVAGFNSIGQFSGNMPDDKFWIRTIFAVFVLEMALTGYWLAICLSPDGKGMPKRLLSPRIVAVLSILIFLASLEVSCWVFS